MLINFFSSFFAKNINFIFRGVKQRTGARELDFLTEEKEKAEAERLNHFLR